MVESVGGRKLRTAEGFLRGRTTKMKVLLPIGRSRAWELIATPEGLSSWFPVACTGRIAIGERLAFHWQNESVERFRIRRVGDKHSSLVLDWRRGAELRLYLHGRLTTLTLEVEYSADPEGREQVRELPIWAFGSANLKSVAMNGRDLRSKSTRSRRSLTAGFITADRGMPPSRYGAGAGRNAVNAVPGRRRATTRTAVAASALAASAVAAAIAATEATASATPAGSAARAPSGCRKDPRTRRTIPGP